MEDPLSCDVQFPHGVLQPHMVPPDTSGRSPTDGLIDDSFEELKTLAEAIAGPQTPQGGGTPEPYHYNLYIRIAVPTEGAICFSIVDCTQSTVIA